MHVFYSDDYVAAAYAFDTTRKARWVAERIADLPGLTLAPPGHLDTVEQAIRGVHDAAYVDALATGTPRELAESQGFDWDPGLWRGIRASTAGVLSAVDRALGGDLLSGSLSSGMHHAKFAHGAGFCSVNALVVAAVHALSTHDVEVTILDLDAHAGGGTDALLRHHALTRVRHLDLTVIPYDSYTHLRPRPNDVNIEDSTLRDDTYLLAVDRLLELLPEGDRHLVLHNAGMDPYPTISFEALAAREQKVAEALRSRATPGVFVLAGGYTWSATPDEVAASHATTVHAFLAAAGGSSGAASGVAAGTAGDTAGGTAGA
jgi:acetoin utilization deacetylase AcuC-like enzyme